MDRDVQKKEFQRILKSEKVMTRMARSERDQARVTVKELNEEIEELKKLLREARAPFLEEHRMLVETQLENNELKRIIMGLEERRVLSERDYRKVAEIAGRESSNGKSPATDQVFRAAPYCDKVNKD